MDFKERLQQVFCHNKIEILNFEGEKKKIRYKCLCCNTEYEYTTARNLYSKITLCKKCYNPFSRWNKERIEERLKRLFPNSQLEVISFQGLRKGGEIKCLKCNTTEKINNFDALFCARKDYFCNNCEKEKDIIFKKIEEELEKGYVKLIQWNGVNEKSVYQCLRCGHIFEKNATRGFSGKYCPNCNKAVNKFSFQEAQEVLNVYGNNEYELLQYKTTNEPSLIKHKCGFIFKTRLSDFKKNRGCPKCYRKISTGERKFMRWLEQNNIEYTYQKRFQDLPRFSFDFEIEIKQKKYLVEIQGQQHYRDVEIFDNLEVQKKRDSIKKEYCLINNIPLIEVPYWEINNLDSFLQNKFNDYPQGVASSEAK